MTRHNYVHCTMHNLTMFVSQILLKKLHISGMYEKLCLMIAASSYTPEYNLKMSILKDSFRRHGIK